MLTCTLLLAMLGIVGCAAIVLGGDSPKPPVMPPQVVASLVGTCYAFDAFNCPLMYINRTFVSMAYFDYVGGRLREDDMISLQCFRGATPTQPDIAYERVWGYNVNATHTGITLEYVLSGNQSFSCVRSLYPGQMNRQDFLANSTFLGRETLRGVLCDKWHVDVPPAYNDYTFYTAAVTAAEGYDLSGMTTVIHRIAANSGAVVVDYYNFRAVAIADSIFQPPATTNITCAIVT
jgi:hypothetical protein